MDLRSVFEYMISVSELGRGQASKVIQSVEDEGNPYIVVKNNKPQAVILSINEYLELMKAKDMINSMKIPVQDPLYNGFPADNAFLADDNYTPRSDSLTEDEINIFLNDEND